MFTLKRAYRANTRYLKNDNDRQQCSRYKVRDSTRGIIKIWIQTNGYEIRDATRTTWRVVFSLLALAIRCRKSFHAALADKKTTRHNVLENVIFSNWSSGQ